jgi:hypothetical protein
LFRAGRPKASPLCAKMFDGEVTAFEINLSSPAIQTGEFALSLP